MKKKKGCIGKIPYFTMREANNIKKRYPKGRIYYCKYLILEQEHLHITTMLKRKVK